MSTQPVITILGAGNMGSALAGGLIAHHCTPNHIWITDPDAAKLNHLQQSLKVQVTQHNEEALAHAQVIILAIKPQLIKTVLEPLAPIIQKNKPLIISIAAGTTIETIQQCLKGNIAIVRAMPNTPALIGCGATGLFANNYVTQAQRQLSESIMRAVGIVVWVAHEDNINDVTAVSGSGPAYFFLVMEAMQEVGIQLGLSADTARLLTLQTAYGAAKMALDSDKTVKELRAQVTSPKGTTEAAIQVFEQGGLRTLIEKALKRAKQRSEELAKNN